MKKNKTLLILTAAFLLVACTKKAVKKDTALDDVVFDSSEKDWQAMIAKINNQLTHIDSLETQEKADEIYLLALDNFINSGVKDERIPKIIMWRGNYYFNKALYSNAIENYRMLINQYPQTPYYIDAMKLIAQAYARNGELENAETWYKKLKKTASDTLRKENRSNLAAVMFRKGREYEKMGKYNLAGSVFYQIFKRFPEAEMAPNAMFAAGMMKQKLKQYKQAITIYRDFIKKYYDSPFMAEVLYQEALCWEYRQFYKKAAKKYLNIIRSFPTSVTAEHSLYKAGLAFEKAQQYTIAARTFERFAELYPQNRNVCEALMKASKTFEQANFRENLKKVKTYYLDLCAGK